MGIDTAHRDTGPSSKNPVGTWASFFRCTMLPLRNLILGIFLPSPVQ